MSRLGKLLVWFWVGVAVWLSERWAWTLPAVIGMALGVWIAKAQQEYRRHKKRGLPPFELGSLLILVSFLYLYLLFLIFQGGEEETGSGVGLGIGVVVLSLLLLGAGAAAIGKLRLPRWVASAWERLLEEH